MQLDITEESSVQNLGATILKEFGRVDYAVNSVGLDLEQYKSFAPMLARYGTVQEDHQRARPWHYVLCARPHWHHVASGAADLHRPLRHTHRGEGVHRPAGLHKLAGRNARQ